MKRISTPKTLYFLYDSAGEFADMFISRKKAEAEVRGPRFAKGYRIVTYDRRPTKRSTPR